MVNLIFKSSRSASFELVNDDIYITKPYDVLMDGKVLFEGLNKNIFSIFDLEPDTDYLIAVNGDICVFRTDDESETINVRDFGAYGDGVHDDTISLQKAILSCKKSGRVLIEKGIYLSGPLFLKDDITIEISKDTIILGKTQREKYPIIPAQIETEDGLIELNTWEGKPNATYASLITGLLNKNVKIIGQGTIDCNAQNSLWWVDHKKPYKGAYRAKGVFLSNCDNISLQGVTVKNTPSWNLHPYFSQNINFIDLTIISPKDSPNTDGCNPESCDRVNILGVDFSVGDDCIAIKSGKFEMGMKYRRPSENITIRNCRMAYGHGAVVLGSEMSGGIRNLEVRQCLFEETDRGLRIKTRRGRGESAIIDQITFEKIKMIKVLNPFVINMYYFCDDDGKTEYVYTKEKLPVDERTPYLGSFTFKDITCEKVHQSAGFFYGLPEKPIESVTLRNVKVDYDSESEPGYPAMMSNIEKMHHYGFFFRYVNDIILDNVDVLDAHGNQFLDYRKLSI